MAALTAFLTAEGFDLLREADVPLTIREHARKYQYIVAHATCGGGTNPDGRDEGYWQRVVKRVCQALFFR